jgi:hypothetical protein
MQMMGRNFWDGVQARTPPSADGSAATLAALRSRFPVRLDTEAEVDKDLWREFGNFREGVRTYKALAAEAEARIREQAGDARTLMVGGKKVGTRVSFSSEVKAHVRHSDYIRITGKEDADD